VSQEPEPDLVARKLAVNRKVLCAAPAYLLALHGTPRVIDDLTGHDGVLFPPLAPKRVWTFHRDGQQHAVPVTARFETDDMDALHAAVVAGMGIGVLPVYVAADDMRRGRLVPLLREFQLLPDVARSPGACARSSTSSCNGSSPRRLGRPVGRRPVGLRAQHVA
jgi:DNA-binding transcriptional LysR family regulator